MMMIVGNSHNMFNPNELEEGNQRTVNHDMGVTNVLGQMRNVVSFKF